MRRDQESAAATGRGLRPEKEEPARKGEIRRSGLSPDLLWRWTGGSR
jgi:hypothetical protein